MLQGSGGTNGEGEEKMMEVEVPVLQRILVGWRRVSKCKEGRMEKLKKVRVDK